MRQMTVKDFVPQAHKNLTEFGYGGLTEQHVEELANAIQRGEPGRDIISLFLVSFIGQNDIELAEASA